MSNQNITRARDRSLARLREGMDLGTGGHIGMIRSLAIASRAPAAPLRGRCAPL